MLRKMVATISHNCLRWSYDMPRGLQDLTTITRIEGEIVVEMDGEGGSSIVIAIITKPGGRPFFNYRVQTRPLNADWSAHAIVGTL